VRGDLAGVLTVVSRFGSPARAGRKAQKAIDDLTRRLKNTKLNIKFKL
jgi:hypothetical protein